MSVSSPPIVASSKLTTPPIPPFAFCHVSAKLLSVFPSQLELELAMIGKTISHYPALPPASLPRTNGKAGGDPAQRDEILEQIGQARLTDTGQNRYE